MAGFDDPGVYYSDAFFSEDRSEEGDLTRVAAQKRFKEFIKTFIDQENRFCYRYRDPHLEHLCTSDSVDCIIKPHILLLQGSTEAALQHAPVLATGGHGRSL